MVLCGVVLFWKLPRWALACLLWYLFDAAGLLVGQPGSLVHHVMALTMSSEYQDLKAFWAQMERSIFSKLDSGFQEAALQYHTQIIKLFLVTAKQRQATAQVSQLDAFAVPFSLPRAQSCIRLHTRTRTHNLEPQADRLFFFFVFGFQTYFPHTWLWCHLTAINTSS